MFVPLQEGPLAFYKGWLPSVIGVVPYVGLNFGVYETLKHMMLVHYGLRDERELSVPARLGCGAAAGTMGQTVAYPFDVARRRLQVCSALWSYVCSVLQYTSKASVTCFSAVWFSSWVRCCQVVTVPTVLDKLQTARGSRLQPTPRMCACAIHNQLESSCIVCCICRCLAGRALVSCTVTTAQSWCTGVWLTAL